VKMPYLYGKAFYILFFDRNLYVFSVRISQLHKSIEFIMVDDFIFLI